MSPLARVSYIKFNVHGLDFIGAECIITFSIYRAGLNLEGASMAYIICEPCVNTKDTACVDACPVDCIHPKKDEPDFEAATMLYINPAECIDCGACEPACPVTAIFPEDNLSLIHISEPTRLLSISYAVFCLKKKKKIIE